MEQVLLETKDLTIKFGDFIANDRINIKLYSGRIHAIAGENGAGKSTLMKMLYGIYQPTSGEICIGKSKLKQLTPAIATENGIGMVFQDFRLIRSFTVIENIFLALKEYGSCYHKAELKKKVSRLAEKYGMNVELDKYVYQMDLGECQQVEILKVLLRENNRLLIFDEPTSALSPREADNFLDMLIKLKNDGYGIVIITHKIREILKVADEVSILVKGRVKKYFADVSKIGEQDIIMAMLDGAAFTQNIAVEDRRIIEKEKQFYTRVYVEGISINNKYGKCILKNAYFDIKPYEIVGVAGISGSGQKELAEALIGLRDIGAGEFYFDNVKYRGKTIRDRLEEGFFWIPEEPMKDVVFDGMTVLEHIEIFNEKIPLTRFGNLDWNEANRDYEKNPFIREFRVADREKEVSTLSGGNIQRMVLARAAMKKPRFLIASYPSRGLDISTVNMVHKIFMQLRNQGCSILLISEDLDELFEMSDRLIVLSNQKLIGPFYPEEFSYDRIGKYMLRGTKMVEVER